MSLIQRLTRIIAGEDYDLDPWDPAPLVDAEPKTPMVGSGKGTEVKALTAMVPAEKFKTELKNFVSMFIPIMPGWMLEFENEERHYLVSKNHLDVLVSDEDVDDWGYLLKRFDDIMSNLTKVLNNIRKIDYHKIVQDKLLEAEIVNRKIKLTENLLEKTQSKEKEGMSDLVASQKINEIMGLLGIMAVTGPMMGQPVGPASADKVAIAKNLEKKYGLKDFQAAAIVGVWMREGLGKGRPDDIEDAFAAQYGDFGPPPIGSSMVGYGWAQWTNMAPGGRLDTVANAIGVTDRNWTDKDNLNAFDWELRNKFPALMGGLKNTTDISEAVQLFTHVYEAGGNIQNFVNMHGQNFMPDRVNSAKSVLSGMTSKQASGAIIIPQIMDNFIWYNTNDKTDDLANFIVDRPTIIDPEEFGEPFVVIPIQRPMGGQMLRLMFKETFNKMERIFERKEKQRTESKPQTPIQNNNTSITRSPIPESIVPTTSKDEQKGFQRSSVSSRVLDSASHSSAMKELVDYNFRNSDTTLTSGMAPLPSPFEVNINNIDTISQKTQSVFNEKIIIMTQDIYTTED